MSKQSAHETGSECCHEMPVVLSCEKNTTGNPTESRIIHQIFCEQFVSVSHVGDRNLMAAEKGKGKKKKKRLLHHALLTALSPVPSPPHAFFFPLCLSCHPPTFSSQQRVQYVKTSRLQSAASFRE